MIYVPTRYMVFSLVFLHSGAYIYIVYTNVIKYVVHYHGEILNTNMVVERFMGAGTAYPAGFIGGGN